MKSLADALPPEIARQIDPDWRKNEAAYWAVRDQLLSQYQGQWIGFADGAVIASGSSPVAVFHAAEATGRSPFVTCVGRENEPVRMRRVSFAYDGSYPGEPLPILTLEFRPVSGAPGVALDRVIADTGADAERTPVGGLSGTATHCFPREAGLDGRPRGRCRTNPSFSCLGLSRRARTSVPTASRLCRQSSASSAETC